MNAPLLLRSGDALTYPRLVAFKRKGLRSRNWARLDIAEKALFRCALWIAKVRGEISNTKLIVQIARITLKLVEGVRSAILKAGKRRTTVMFETYAKPFGVFSWASQVREWLNDTKYIWYLGVLGVNSRL
jgi:hypothetical protein